MRSLDEIFAALSKSTFRRRFRLGKAETAYLRDHGLAAVLAHAARFINERLAPAEPANDGKQTPWRGHPVFIAQHATATCCRGCLSKWHGIAKGKALTSAEAGHVVSAIERWLRSEQPNAASAGRQHLLFNQMESGSASGEQGSLERR